MERKIPAADVPGILRIIQSTSTKDISKAEEPDGFNASIEVAKRCGNVAKIARQALEIETGKSVITSESATELNQVVADLIEGVVENEE